MITKYETMYYNGISCDIYYNHDTGNYIVSFCGKRFVFSDDPALYLISKGFSYR